jgi:hypothetical protein
VLYKPPGTGGSSPSTRLLFCDVQMLTMPVHPCLTDHIVPVAMRHLLSTLAFILPNSSTHL